MAHMINHEKLTKVDGENPGLEQYTTEASSIRLRPGQWPDRIECYFNTELIVFYRGRPDVVHDELKGVEYNTKDGEAKLFVIND